MAYKGFVISGSNACNVCVRLIWSNITTVLWIKLDCKWSCTPSVLAHDSYKAVRLFMH
jgi:hypothetical protein